MTDIIMEEYSHNGTCFGCLLDVVYRRHTSLLIKTKSWKKSFSDGDSSSHWPLGKSPVISLGGYPCDWSSINNRPKVSKFDICSSGLASSELAGGSELGSGCFSNSTQILPSTWRSSWNQKIKECSLLRIVSRSGRVSQGPILPYVVLDILDISRRFPSMEDT